jgi:hypothetical protein
MLVEDTRLAVATACTHATEERGTASGVGVNVRMSEYREDAFVR